MLFGSRYTMAEHVFVFGVHEKWQCCPLKVKEMQTDFAAALVSLRELFVYRFKIEGRLVSHGDRKEMSK